ncbi:MAG: hypothetical protein ACPGJS_18180 [Flammeovirgaceae bacterium]
MISSALQQQAHFFAQLTHPAFVNGNWEKSRYGKSTSAIPVLNGTFTPLGFVPQHSNTVNRATPAVLEEAMSLSQTWVNALKEGNCYHGLGSEGDLYWYPIVLPKTQFTTPTEIATAFGAQPPQEVAAAYQAKSIRSTYSHQIEVEAITQRENIFWPNSHQARMQEHAQSFHAYSKVSVEMKRELDQIHLIQFYPDYIEFPVAIMGKHKKYGIQMGLITAVVWT